MKIPLLLIALFTVSFLPAKTPLLKLPDPHSALKPEARRAPWWLQRHDSMNSKATAKPHDILFIGDSITQGWEGPGKAIWEDNYAEKNALNLGISGDRTEHVIWRLQNGNLKNQENAQLAIIMIGTNNTGHSQQDPAQTAQGITKIVSIVKEKCPKAKILLLAVFPRAEKPDDKLRKLNEQINTHIKDLHDGETVHYLDLSPAFLTEDGILTKEIMPDGLHPQQKGYAIWAEAMAPKIKELTE